MRTGLTFAAVSGLFAASLGAAVAQRPGVYNGSRDHEAIRYSTGPVNDEVSKLNAALEAGRASLTFQDDGSAYLRSVLQALDIPVSSQMLAFAQTSAQARQIDIDNPRAVYFNDTTTVAWVRGGDILEFAVQDPTQGALFFTLPMTATERPRFTRNDGCLECHLSWDTLGIPGLVLQTVFPRKSDRDYANGGFVDHRLPIDQRWGGWYVTGAQVPARHMGNQPMIQPTPRHGPARKLATVRGEFDLKGYLTDTSDVVALLVFDHQIHAGNLITRLNWEARAGTPASVDEAVRELADYLLFVDEEPLPGKVVGSSGFAEAFAARGKKDADGRSLRTLRLDGRLMEYPVSYMVDTPAFRALPDAAREAVLTRIRKVLRDGDPAPKYAHLTPALRKTTLAVFEGTR
ncbi:MAG: hypothetical protein IT178_01525 [Acidobacteria bacterium]|nr:hypothetical protein [Acidobacteriota bacterium]